MTDLNSLWFALVGLLFIGYAILDGFDLGVGALHLFTHTDEERRVMINAIGPVWDGNEVWLVTGGGALFAAFPEVYATAFSGFYVPFMLLLFALILRAVAIEFRSKRASHAWRRTWDVSFTAASLLGSLLIGVALGNIAWGIPLGPGYEYLGSFWDLLNPYALLVGVTTVALFMMHGAIYLTLKTEGAIHDKVRGWINNTIIFFIICYATTTMATLLFVPHMTDNIRNDPVLFVLPLLNMLAIANIPREIHHGHDFRAFLSSAAAMFFLLVLFGVDMYPRLILSSPLTEHSLTIWNAASSDRTLGIMGIIALIGLPLVLTYTITIYWVFRGKVRLDRSSY
ncbi:MAG TPA: cytochrome d ubiquinol oxidase subunit II [candidate division Zixibacteria bacterium]|nr:cytochrome d ubiquinol oxidase subunit II [candidate division Zixibacteria bacterium]MDD4917946.1 cytochrome d ubiquinol oxidase subunit II [candidate division Zixibacteria bacterium]MDM7972502.1 cytochrome d ubiquinol oxidase subunit II [candidate division Zixibacteria bacterium]HOD65243.1 cytochrome d ubiquinol oxidase subunit II [candidate division Zixibacteria bacterium]HPI32701.1 cytochrome d ubiquinol oxidase subunit II [candidate division Zixibacteria bacterium]